MSNMIELLLVLILYLVGAVLISTGVFLLFHAGVGLIVVGVFTLVAAAIFARGIARVPTG